MGEVQEACPVALLLSLKIAGLSKFMNFVTSFPNSFFTSQHPLSSLGPS
jgi:hypothetical protein